MRHILVVLAFSIIPFGGIFFYDFDTTLSDNPDCLRNDSDKTGFIKSIIGMLFMISTNASGGQIISVRRVVQLAAALLHSLNSILLLTLIDEYLIFQRRYGQQIRSACGTVMTLLFAAHSMRIAVLKDSTTSSLALLLSLSFSLCGLIVGLNFLSVYNSNKTKLSTLILFVLSCLLQTIGIVLHSSTAIIPFILIAGISMSKLRIHRRAVNWIDTMIAIGTITCCYILYLTWTRNSNIMNSNMNESTSMKEYTSTSTNTVSGTSTSINDQQMFNIFKPDSAPSASSVLRSFLEIYQSASNVLKAQIGFPPNFDPDYALNKLKVLSSIQGSLQGSLQIKKMRNMRGNGLEMSGDLGLMSILDLVVVMTIIMSLIIKCVYDIIRYRTMSNLNFSCLAFIVLITVACAPSDLGADGDLLHFDTLAISMQSYIPSCFLSFCLGE